jgi:hypothetical protein
MDFVLYEKRGFLRLSTSVSAPVFKSVNLFCFFLFAESIQLFIPQVA